MGITPSAEQIRVNYVADNLEKFAFKGLMESVAERSGIKLIDEPSDILGNFASELFSQKDKVALCKAVGNPGDEIESSISGKKLSNSYQASIRDQRKEASERSSHTR